MTGVTPELVACPFCGGAGRLARVGRMHEIICDECEAAGPLSFDPAHATDAWNHRVNAEVSNV